MGQVVTAESISLPALSGFDKHNCDGSADENHCNACPGEA